MTNGNDGGGRAFGHHKFKAKLGSKAFSWPKGGCSMAVSTMGGSYWLRMAAIKVERPTMALHVEKVAKRGGNEVWLRGWWLFGCLARGWSCRDFSWAKERLAKARMWLFRAMKEATGGSGAWRVIGRE